MFRLMGLSWKRYGRYRGEPIAIAPRVVSWGIVWDAYTAFGNVLFCNSRDDAIKEAIAEIKRGR